MISPAAICRLHIIAVAAAVVAVILKFINADGMRIITAAIPAGAGVCRRPGQSG